MYRTHLFIIMQLSFHILRIKVRQYYNMQFSKYKDNLKETWKLIGTLVKRKTKGQTFPTRIIHNNRTFTQEKDIAEWFNNFFVNIGPTWAKEIKFRRTCTNHLLFPAK